MNLAWAFAYNIVMLPIVSGMLYSVNITLSPVWSSIAMSASSIVVVLFSQLMSCFKYDDSKEVSYDDGRFSETNNSLSKLSESKPN
jgi:Cu+-exporting ATPase